MTMKTNKKSNIYEKTKNKSLLLNSFCVLITLSAISFMIMILPSEMRDNEAIEIIKITVLAIAILIMPLLFGSIIKNALNKD